MPNDTKNLNDSAYLEELIDQLCDSDRYIDLDLMATIMAQGEGIVDRLIEVMEQDDDWPMIHAMLMLIEMRAEKALSAIGSMLLENPDLNEWVDRDGLEKYGPVAIDTLEGVFRDADADWSGHQDQQPLHDRLRRRVALGSLVGSTGDICQRSSDVRSYSNIRH